MSLCSHALRTSSKRRPSEVQSAGGIATAVVTDVQDADGLSGGVDRVRAELGPPVVLVDNAAVVAPWGSG
jgi:3-oxoacyl-[acyl-carrier protein] reductase